MICVEVTQFDTNKAVVGAVREPPSADFYKFLSPTA
jgi:hypothetical protein